MAVHQDLLHLQRIRRLTLASGRHHIHTVYKRALLITTATRHQCLRQLLLQGFHPHVPKEARLALPASTVALAFNPRTQKQGSV